MQRVIREQEPAKPSTKLSTLGETSTEVAKRCGCTPDLLRKAVRGDLDWIVMKSLEKDRARRYETASGLAEDIRRHLEHEPVVARGPGAAYRLRKFLRRHRAEVLGALALAVVTGVVVVILSMWNRDRAQLAEAEGFKHRSILSQAREQYAKAERDAALETIRPILASPHAGAEARLLEATIFVDNRQPKEAVAVLGGLLDEKPEVAGTAHSLLARILWESGSPDAQKLEEIEEHRRQAEALLPETAEAYFLRAMTAITVKEQLASLDQALQLDSSHYESRRLRAYTYYASRKYDRLRDDALAMTILRPRDPLGYSLRAAALRELGKYHEAIAAYDNALALTPQADPQYLALLEQRSEALLRMGEYERLIAETPAGAKDLSPLRYHLFCALTALGEYEEATALYRQIIAASYSARSRFQDWCAKYVFDTLEAGRSWHLPDQEALGAAFLPMIEAEETYRNLSAKGAHRLTTDGFSAQWSPDGGKLAFSLGVQGRSGVALFDPATKETDLLIVPGKDPKWSPDGRHIAFVRDREGLRLEELAVADRDSQRPPETGEEVWVMNADGTAPRRLAQGSWPTWASDSAGLYYLSRGDGTLSRLSLVDPAATPKPIMKWSSVLPSVSPDSRQVAHFESGSLKITDLASQKVVAECKGPPMSWGTTSWSPTGSEVCLGGGNPQRDKTGLWIYDLGSKQFGKVLDGQITATCWSRGGREFAFCLGAPYHEIWVNSLNAGMSTADALGASRTLERHYREMVAFYTRRIKTDPMDADAYLRRAQQYHFLRHDAKVQRDMRLYSAIVTQGKLADLELSSPSGRGHVIDGPFGYQVVLSAEERDDGTDALSVAFGQKGRCMMKAFEVPMFVASLLSLCALPGLDAPPAYAEFALGEAMRTSLPTSSDEFFGCLSYDGLEMYIDSMRAGGQGATDLWVLRRSSIEEDWGSPENLGALVNSGKYDELPSISADGLTLYFQSDRDHTWPDIYMTTRPDRNAPWGPAVNLGPAVNRPGAGDCMGSISADNLEFYFSSYRSGGYGRSDIYVARRATPTDPWDQAMNLGPIVNSGTEDQFPCLSPDGLLLFFSDWHQWGDPPRPGGHGGCDIWMSRRASLSDPWEAPVNLGPRVNTSSHESIARISPDGRTLYFWSNRSGGWWWYQASIDPILDLNGDGRVNHEDMMVLRTHWGQNYPPCDIGPFPWGDGIVDMEDLKVLMRYTGGTGADWTEPAIDPSPGALEIPCDAILRWTSAGLGETHDVYFGTSLDDVTRAERDNPLGVLVSLGQVETTYDPPGLLEFGRTYYWRIDEVGGAPDFTIYKGPVMDFTTESLAYPIEAVVATSNAISEAGAGPENTVNGAGLNAAGEHSTSAGDMWLATKSADERTWVQYEFDGVYSLYEMWVWNYNSQFEPILGFGLKDVTVEYSANGTDWTTLGDVQLAQATAKGTYTHNTAIDFAGAAARYVRLIVHSGWGTLSAQYGLSEVRFFYLPVYPSKPSPVSGRKGIGVDTVLTWKAGRKAALHQVHLSTNQQVVTNGDAPVAAVTYARFDPGSLDLGRKYYWRIDEVNEAEAVSVWEGEVWNFSTLEYLMVDDFEGYNDDEGQGTCIYQSWIDGWTNGTGSRVGNLFAPFAEQNVVRRGRQAMPLAYNNSESPFYSQAERTFSMVQDWTANGADTLTLWFRGNPMGFLERADGSIQMSGGGVDIWDTSDQFRFAHKQLDGDGSIIAKIHSLTATSGWAKAGVMIRDNLTATSAYVFMTPTPDGRRAFQHRLSPSGMAISVHSNAGAVTFPLWVKVERKGNNFTGYYSQDGQNWAVSTPDDATSNSTNPVRVLLTGEVYIGLAVTSHNLSMPTIAEFSNVSFTGEVTGQWQVEAIGVEQPSNDLAPLYVTVEDDAGHSKAVTHPDPAAVQTIDWQPWMIPLSEFTSAGVTMTNVKKMSIGVGDQRSATAGGAGVIYIDDIGFGHPLSSE